MTQFDNMSNQLGDLETASKEAESIIGSMKEKAEELEAATKLAAEVEAIHNAHSKTRISLKDDFSTLEALITSVADNELTLKANIENLKIRARALKS